MDGLCGGDMGWREKYHPVSPRSESLFEISVFVHFEPVSKPNLDLPKQKVTLQLQESKSGNRHIAMNKVVEEALR